MSLNVLAHTSNHLKEKIEKVDMRNHDFVSLIEMFADEEWQNVETYNSFINGFGENFDEFSSSHSVTFIQKLIQAGVN